MIDWSVDWIEHGLVTYPKFSTMPCRFSFGEGFDESRIRLIL